MRTLWRRVPRYRWGALVAMVSLALSGCGVSLQALPKIGGISGPTYGVHATFANVVNLPANAQVRTGSFPVGYVTSITASNFKAHVTMRIRDSVRLPVGTTAQIRFDTPLGEDYVLLQPPPSPARGRFLGNGAVLTESQTTTAPSVEDTLGALGALLNGGGIDQLQTIIDQTNKALDANRAPIHSLINSLNTTVGSFASNATYLDNALAAMGNLSQVLNQGSGFIVGGIDALQPAVAVLSSENADLNQLLKQLNQLSAVANNVLDRSAGGTVSTLQQLTPVLHQLSAVQNQLGPALAAIDSFEKLTPRAVPGNYVQVALSGTIQVPPVPSDALPPQKVTIDPPDPNLAYNHSGIVTLIEGGLP